MRRTYLLLSLTLVVGIAMGVIADRVLIAGGDVKRAELIRQDLPGIEGKQVIVFFSDIGPGLVLSKHYHPGHEFVYVVEGNGILEAEGKTPLRVKKGDVFYQPPNQKHRFKNASQTERVKNLVFLIAEEGKPFAIEVK